jgi:biotin carboxylase
MNFVGKRLLILCGNSIHCKVVEAAKEMGIYTIVTDSIPFEAAPAKQIADEALMFNVLDINGIVKWCNNNPVDGVINFCNDIGQRPQQQICERLGLHSYGTKEQYFKLTDKRAFKRTCIECGVDVIKEYTEEDLKNNVIEYPVLVKPVDSRGSRGQTVCNSNDKVVEALLCAKEASSNHEAIIEQYMVGKQDFSFSYLIINGRAYLIKTGDRYCGKKEDHLDKVCIGAIAPSNYTDLFIDQVESKLKNLISHIGLRNAPLFMQGFVDGESFRFYDPGLRLPGTEYECTLYRATGISLMKCCIEIALTGKIEILPDRINQAFLLEGNISVQLLISARGGKISTISGLHEIASHSNIVSISQRYFVNDTIPNTGDVRQRFCEIAILANKSEVKTIIEWVQSKLIVLDENGNDMLVSYFDTTILPDSDRRTDK